jgi:hypothetical protein
VLNDVIAWAAAHKAVAGAGALGAVGLGLYTRHKKAAAGPAAQTGAGGSSSPTNMTLPTYDSTANDVYNAIESQLQTVIDAQNAQKPATAIGNEAWRRQAFDALKNKGYDPLTVDNNLRAYLSGIALTGQGQVIIRDALGTIGLPPDAVQAPPRTGGPLKFR